MDEWGTIHGSVVPKLEAENKALRDAAQAVVDARGIHRYHKPMDVAIDAFFALLEGKADG
jgi:hypothetical protein